MDKSGIRTNVDVNKLVEFFSFRVMLMPRIIIMLNLLVTVLGVAALIGLPVAMLYFGVTEGEARSEIIRKCGESFVSVLLGLLACRLAFEYLILFFRMNETLTEILRKNDALPPTPAPVFDIHQFPSRLDTEPPITLAPPEPVYVAPALPQLQPENEIRPGDIVFDCPYCGHNHAISPKGAGISVNCMKCGKSITVPQ